MRCPDSKITYLKIELDLELDNSVLMTSDIRWRHELPRHSCHNNRKQTVIAKSPLQCPLIYHFVIFILGISYSVWMYM